MIGRLLYHVHRKLGHGLNTALVAVARLPCRHRYNRRPRVGIEPESGNLGVVGMGCKVA
jgi:hypothetical protein